MAYRSDAATERLYLNATLPNPAISKLTIMGWFKVTDRNDYSTYWRTSSGGGTINTVATDGGGLGVNVFTPTTSITNTYSNSDGQWIHIATVDDTGSVVNYVTPEGGSIVSQSGTILSAVSDQLCLLGRRSDDATEWGNMAVAYVRVFAGKLTQAQVEAERDSAVAILSAWADWPLSTGTDLNDVSGNGRHLTAVGAGGSTEAGPPISGTQTISPSGIASAESMGAPTVTPGSVSLGPTGVTSTEAFGTDVVSPGPVTATPAGIPSAEATGTPSVVSGGVTISLVGIGSAEAFGTPVVIMVVEPGAIVSAEQFGLSTVTPGSVVLAPSGIASAAVFGAIAVIGGDTRILWPPAAGKIWVMGVATGEVSIR